MEAGAGGEFDPETEAPDGDEQEVDGKKDEE